MDNNSLPIMSADIKCTFSLRVRDDVFKPGRVRVHLPAPINADWLFMGQVLESSPQFRMISIEDHPQRSVWFDEVLDRNVDFSVTYAFESAPEKVTPDITEINKSPQPGRKIDSAMIKKFEENEHCDCGSYTGPLSDRVTVMDLVSETGITRMSTGEASGLLGMTARDFEKTKEKPGDLIKKIFDRCAGNDCVSMSLENLGQEQRGKTMGVMSRNEILVALMRSCGIPARWQGGFRIKDGRTVPADWAIVNAAPYGWIYMDAQAAHEAFETGNTGLAGFYFGGIDALRIPTAAKTAAGLYPARDYVRSDERYNLFGEVELEERGLEAGEFSTTVRLEH